MCQICAAFNPFLNNCEYEGLVPAPDGADPGIGPQVAQSVDVNEVGDAGNTTSTAASMDVGDVFMGALQTSSDSDWVAVELVAGQQYTVAIAGTDALTLSNDDPYLRLRDASGNVISLDDDGGPGRYSSYTFTASYTGTYYLDAQSWNNSDAGTYGMSIVEGSRAYYNDAMGAGSLLRPDQAWTTTPGTGATVSWGVRASGVEPSGGNPFVQLSAAQVAAAQDVMSYFDDISGLNLNQVNPGGTTNSATILIGAYSDNDGSGAYAYYPGSIGGNTSFGSNAGDIWMNNNAGSTTNLPIGSYSYFVFLHELGHSIGLAHPGDYNAAPGVSITYNNNAQYTQDSHQYTVMSYFDETNTGVSSGLGYPDTLMLHDLLAIHQLYGADTSYHAGATVYGFNATHTNTAYDFSFNTTPFLSIYDGNGIDTIDLSGYNMAQYLNLNQGTFSDIGGYNDNMSIAYGAVIENAIGGSGNDTIEGNAANNEVTGGNGTDTFVMDINRAGATIIEIAGGYQVTSSLGTDTLYGVEFIQFNDQTLDLSTIMGGGGPTTGNDNLSGTTGNDSINLLAGNDEYSGGGGSDTVNGGDGNDTLNGGSGDDWLHGNANEDELNGGANNDTLFGGAGHDTLNGGSGNDTLFGGNGGGQDSLNGGANEDRLEGGDGNDTLLGNNGHDTLLGGTGEDTLRGGAGRDSLEGGNGHDSLRGEGGDDIMLGQSGNDTLWGGAGDDSLYGGGNDDALYGGANNDRLNGNAGDDTLNGGSGSDVFVFADNFGQDVIEGFAANDTNERIDLSQVSSISDLTDLIDNHMTQVGSDVVIDDGNGNTITILNTTEAQLSDGNDFLF